MRGGAVATGSRKGKGGAQRGGARGHKDDDPQCSPDLRKSRRSVNTDLAPAGSQRVGRSTGGESATKGLARNRPFSDDARVERWTFRAVLMLAPVAFVTKVFVTRSIWSWLFEVLPVFLLAMQSLAAVSNHGDVDGRSSQPLFAPALRCGDVWMSSANAKIQNMLGRWSIQERHNIDEFMEGVDTCARAHARARVRVAHARSRHRSAVPHGMPSTLATMLCFMQCFRLIPQRSLSRRLHVHACARPPSLPRVRSSGLRFMAACADCARGAVDHARAWRRQGRRHAAHRHARPAWHIAARVAPERQRRGG